ncbi:MAG: hypothetical protein AB7F31_04595 [Parachlamydiales bacterium]
MTKVVIYGQSGSEVLASWLGDSAHLLVGGKKFNDDFLPHIDKEENQKIAAESKEIQALWEDIYWDPLSRTGILTTMIGAPALGFIAGIIGGPWMGIITWQAVSGTIGCGDAYVTATSRREKIKQVIESLLAIGHRRISRIKEKISKLEEKRKGQSDQGAVPYLGNLLGLWKSSSTSPQPKEASAHSAAFGSIADTHSRLTELLRCHNELFRSEKQVWKVRNDEFHVSYDKRQQKWRVE